ncbi:molybdopterin converting factor small subunit [Saccharothrix tamanrassetensis]|uniref:Molybdopterin synthase sulfur carrier subunit n=1 Tax=Saccharothrix tamanrassetensis TaxID=1051531 RepID=A0A841CK38_9PSEU|nr:MoaD/ThiS family protein [Saccharothrix tamanrassetensis]MBB5956538.1 molybdopterin converting factor small subunit [Saccharothrix tamanrassetensis]
MVQLTVRYFAGARAAAGVPDESLELPGAVTVARVLDAVRSRHGDGLGRVLAACSFLLDGVAVRDRDTPVSSGSRLDVLPPFAGG